jgi:site-specific DNA-methyltransferase (adenine-specific)
VNIEQWKRQGKPFNVILHGDCMDLMAELGEHEIDLAVVDPPYGLERFKSGGSHVNKYGSEKGEWNNVKPDKKYFDELFRISKNQIIWGGNNFELPTSEYFIIWQKSNVEKFSFAMCEMAWTSCKIPAKIFKKLHVENGDIRIHPTQKPVALYRWILQNYAKAGQTIIDTHSGSGSLACACHLEKFNFIAIEKDYDYWLASVKRYEELKSQGVLF